MSVGRVLEPKVELDRDGRPLRVRQGGVSAGAYDYPDPQTPPGWLRLPLKLDAVRAPSRGPRQSAAVYAEDGTLVRTLLADAAGVAELWWDGLDDQGAVAPAGKYQLKAVCHDVRIADDGAMGDNGNPLGAFNPDNADRVVALPDGGFIAHRRLRRSRLPAPPLHVLRASRSSPPPWPAPIKSRPSRATTSGR